MTECPSKQQLDQLLREELSDPELTRIMAHVEECPVCQETLAELSLNAPGPAEPSLQSALSETGFSEPDTEIEAFFDRLKNQSRSESAPRPEIAGYEILEEIGRGAAGVVYRARHRELNRLVALKLILAGPYLSPEGRLRFRREAQAVARLQHPNIVQIFDVGEHTGYPFLTLELVEGTSLSRWLGGFPRSARDAAEITAILAKAVDYAHRQGVIHRDLKPANILLSDRRSADTPTTTPANWWLGPEALKITDFGLAKFTTESGVVEDPMTQAGAIMGTPAYAAPEQARGETTKVGPAADVYSLGVILYEMLTGRPPFQGTTSVETLVQAAHHEPVSPGQLAPKTPRDLQTICLKCLEKDPTKRYLTAHALAADLERFLKHEPIHARPVGVAERLLRWMRRHKGFSASMAVVALLLLVLVVGSLLAATHFRNLERAQRALASEKGKLADEMRGLADEKGKLADEKDRLVMEKELEREKAVSAENREAKLRQHAEQQSQELRQSLYFARMNLIGQAVLAPSGGGRIREFLNPWIPHDEEPTHSDLRQWEWYYLNGLCFRAQMSLPPRFAELRDIAWRSDGQRLASGAADGTVRLWDIAAGLEIRVLRHSGGGVRSVAWSQDGRRVAAACSDGMISIWDAENGKETLTYRGHAGAVTSVAWSPDDSRLASGGVDRTIRVWNAETGAKSQELRGHIEQVVCVAWSPDGQRLASAGYDGAIRLWSCATGKEIRELTGHGNWVNKVVWRPDGSQLASASNDRSVIIWDPNKGKVVRELFGHSEAVLSVAWSPDGSRLATSSEDQTLKVWSAEGDVISTLRGRAGPSVAVAWSSNGNQLASADSDGCIKIWDAHAPAETLTLQSPEGDVNAIGWCEDGRLLVSGSSLGPVQVWDTALGKQLCMLDGHAESVHSVACAPRGERVASAGADGVVRVWNIRERQILQSLRGHSGDALSVAWSSNAQRLASGGEDGTVRIWDATTGEQTQCFHEHNKAVHTVAWSPDGTQIVSGSWDNTVKFWDVATGRVGLSLSGHPVTSVAWSPDGSRLAASENQTIQFWDTRNGATILILRGHASGVKSVSWSPDGMRLASVGLDRIIKIWDSQTGQEALTLAGQAAEADAVAWSPDGLKLASAWCDQTILIHDATPGYEASLALAYLTALDRRGAADAKGQSDWRLRAEIHARQKNWEAAAADSRKLLSLNPDKHWLTASAWVAGPYPDDHNVSYPPEKNFDVTQIASGNGEANTSPEVRWRYAPLNANGFIDFGEYCDHAEHISAYAVMQVYSQEQRSVAALFGADDQVRLWFNGKMIYENMRWSGLEPDSVAAPATLSPGWNTFLARVFNGTRHHGLYFRLSDAPADLARAQNATKN